MVTNYPSLPRILLILAVMVPCPGKPLGPWQTWMVGCLRLDSVILDHPLERCTDSSYLITWRGFGALSRFLAGETRIPYNRCYKKKKDSERRGACPGPQSNFLIRAAIKRPGYPDLRKLCASSWEAPGNSMAHVSGSWTWKILTGWGWGLQLCDTLQAASLSQAARLWAVYPRSASRGKTGDRVSKVDTRTTQHVRWFSVQWSWVPQWERLLLSEALSNLLVSLGENLGMELRCLTSILTHPLKGERASPG